MNVSLSDADVTFYIAMACTPVPRVMAVIVVRIFFIQQGE